MRYALSAILVLSALCFCPSPAHAMLEKSDHFTASERAGFALYKLADLKPDFHAWIANDPLQTSRDAKIARLERGFDRFSPSEDMISINGPATVILPEITHAQAIGPYRNIKPVQIYLGRHDKVYFPCIVAGKWIALVPSNMDSFEDMTMSNDSYESLKRHIGVPHNYIGMQQKVFIRMEIRADKVDVSRPVKLAGKNMWLLSGEIADFEIWDSQQKELAWSYAAPWYKPDDSNELLDLYGN